MMQREELAAMLREALIKRSRIRIETVRDGDRLMADCGLDSFAVLNVILDIEDRLDIEIDPARLVEVREVTFAGFVTLVASEIERQAPGRFAP